MKRVQVSLWVGFLFAGLLVTETTFAQEGNPDTGISEPAPAPGYTVTYHIAEGDPITATLDDGREMTLYLGDKKPLRAPIALSIHENQCTGVTDVGGKMFLTIQRFSLGWIWSKNPNDPSRVGKIVKARTKPADEFKALDSKFHEDFHEVYSSFNYFFPDAKRRIAGDQIEFNKLDIIPGLTTTSTDFEILAWSTETMLVNPETGVSENMSFNNAFNLKFTKIGPRLFEVVDVHSFAGVTAPEILLYGEVIDWRFRRPDGSICLVALKSDISETVKYVDEYELIPFAYKDPYLFNSDVLPRRVFDMGELDKDLASDGKLDAFQPGIIQFKKYDEIGEVQLELQ